MSTSLCRLPSPLGDIGMFSPKPCQSGAALMSIPQPLVAILNTEEFPNYCANCHLKGSENKRIDVGDYGDKVPLFSCAGCKIVKYCGKPCQARSWRRIHKYECRLFTLHNPYIMPFPIRALLQILLLRDNGCLNDEQWASVLSLQSHESEFQEEAGERWNTIKLMSNAVKGYSGTDIGIPTIQGLFCRLFVNSFSLVTPGLDSIGTAFDPKPSQINHSCEPNAFIVFDGPSITIRSLHEIKKDEEIFISYVDTSLPCYRRQATLKRQFFFHCLCAKCQKGDLFEKSELEKRVFALEDSKDKKKLSSAETLSFYQGALREIRNIRPPWPPNRQPLPIIHDTIALEHLLEGRWSLALAHYLVIYFHIDPRSNPEPFHPERVVHSWRLAKLFAQISSLAASKPEEVQMLDPYSLKYPAILLGFLTEVDSNVDRSHGSNSRFARTVRVRVAEVGIIKGHDAFQRWGITKVHMEEEWRKLRKIADELAQ